MSERPAIYEYFDYRAFLRDMFSFRKKKNRYYSYRFFARESGFASPNFLKLVMDGQRNLTNESVAKIAKGFQLKKPEREFLENLVFMNQAPNHEERNYYYQKMMAAKGFTEIRKIDKERYEYFSRWYCPVIREIVGYSNAPLEPEDIAPLLDPPITPKEARDALNLLLELDLIRKKSGGEWEKANKTITTGPEVRSLVVANFHREMIRLGAEAIERHPAEARDITSVTVSVRGDRMAEFKEKTAAFRRELLKMACEEEAADQVIQVNIQVFPLTKPYTGEKP